MKILFIAEGCHPATQGGIQTFGRVLKKIYKEDLSFLAYATPKSKKIFIVEDVIEVFTTNIFGKILNKLLKNKIRNYLIKKEIERINPEICILRSPQNLRLIKNKNIKKILVQHTNFDRYIFLKDYYGGDDNLIGLSKKQLNYFIFLSKYDKERFVKELNFPKEKIGVIRHTCELELLETSKKSKKELIMIARLDNEVKRFDLVIKAMKKLPEFNLRIYGEGPDKNLLKSLLKECQLKNVFLYGGTNQIKDKLDDAGIFIMTSDSEAYGITNIEAMRRGLPIILRNTFEAAQDIVIDNGILLEKEWNEDKFIESVKKIYNNYKYYSKNSIKLGKRHNLEVIKKEWDKLIVN
ncbi:hypothetical protein F350042L8_09810 [Fusobacterium ulcerans]|uniref:glycosyltransferase n=1 Tax=Fusobacterium ulcerans TaxID=861 RepID=UPI0034BF8EF3